MCYYFPYMDFVDPKKRRAAAIKLFIGYVLIAIAIVFGTVILVYEANGYSVDKTGNVVQNGLLFVDANRSPADIYINDGPSKNRTAARLVLPAGNYKVAIKRAGYRDWVRNFSLEERSIERLVYAFLFPTELVPKNLHAYKTGLPPLVSQSPDRKWLVVQTPATTGAFNFDLYDLSKPPNYPLKNLSIPASLITQADKPGTYKEIEWASDNKSLLLEHSFTGGKEFIVLDREVPSSSVNVNRFFGITPDQLQLRDKKADQFYSLVNADGSLRQLSIKDRTVSVPMVDKVLDFKPYGTNVFIYVTNKNQPAGKVQSRIFDNGQSYALSEMSAGSQYFVDSAKYQGDWFFIAGSNTDGAVKIFKNPLDQLKGGASSPLSSYSALRVKNIQKAAFSDNTRFVMATNGQDFAVYDFEDLDYYHYSVSQPLSAPMHWMDGNRLIGTTGGQSLVMDFDGTNQQILTPTSLEQAAYFDRDFNEMFVISPITAADLSQGYSLLRYDLRAKTDIPPGQQ